MRFGNINYFIVGYIIEIIIGCVVAIITFFLKRTMDQLDKTTVQCYKNEHSIDVLSRTFELKHDNLGQQMEKLSNSLDKLADKIDTLHEAVNEIKYR